MKSPIFITGIERSGSTIIAQILESCGVFGGDTTTMRENKGIRAYVDLYYKQIRNIDIKGQFPLPDPESLAIPIRWKSDVEELIKKDLYKTGEWYYKSSRLGQVWPVWHYAFPDAKWIIVRRRTGDIISSCEKTGFMKAFKNPENCKAIGVESEKEGWLWWIRQHEQRFVEMVSAGLDCKVIWPERMREGNYQQVNEMIRWCGLKWNGKVVSTAERLLNKTN